MRHPAGKTGPLTTILAPIVVVALSITGCLRDPDPFPLPDGELTLHFVLEAGTDSVVGLVTRSTESASEREIPDATVQISTGADTVTLTYEPDDRCAEMWLEWPMHHGCYQAALSAPVEPGRTYQLEVVLSDGVRGTGETTVPAPVSLTSPVEGARLVVECGDPIRCGATVYTNTFPTVAEWPVGWSSDGPDAGGIGLSPTAVFLDDQVYPGDTCRPSYGSRPHSGAEESAVLHVLRFDCARPLDPARFDSIHADLVVYSVNDAYRQYIEGIGDETIRVDAAAAGVEGAWGLFGAVTPTVREVVLVRDPPPGPPPNTR